MLILVICYDCLALLGFKINLENRIFLNWFGGELYHAAWILKYSC